MKSLGPEARALIDAASRQEALPSAQSLKRVRRSIAYKAMAASVATSSASLGAAALGSKAGLAGASLTVQLASAALAGALTGGAMLAVSAPWRDAPAISATASPRSTSAAPAGLRNAPRGAAAPDLHTPESFEDPPAHSVASDAPPVPIRREPIASTAARPAAPRAPKHTGEPIAAPAELTPAPAPAPPTLALEMQVLRQARQALQNGRASEVLFLLDQYEATFRGGALEEEARAARVAALCRLGREDEARREIAAIARRWPDSPLVVRLGGACLEGAGRSP